MHLTPMFANAIGWDRLDIDNKKIEDYCYAQEEAHPDIKKALGWQSELVDLTAEPLAELVAEVKLKLQEITGLYNIQDDYAPQLTTSWININKPNGRVLQNNVPHLHPGRFFSFVYYVKAEINSGNLDLESPMRDLLGYAIPLQIYKGFNPFNSVKWTITPEPGKLIVFPGWIKHHAGNNQSNSDRISIAFNADLQNLDKIYYPNRVDNK